MTLLMSLVMTLVFAFTVVTAVRVMRAEIPKKKRWLLVALVGVGTLSYTSPSGDFGVQLLSIQLLSVGFMGEFPGGPHLFKVSFPLGALLALRRLEASPLDESDAEQRSTIA